MLIEALSLKRALQRDIEEIASAMMNGVATWEDYQRLVGHAKACLGMLESLKKIEEQAAMSEGAPSNV